MLGHKHRHMSMEALCFDGDTQQPARQSEPALFELCHTSIGILHAKTCCLRLDFQNQQRKLTIQRKRGCLRSLGESLKAPKLSLGLELTTLGAFRCKGACRWHTLCNHMVTVGSTLAATSCLWPTLSLGQPLCVLLFGCIYSLGLSVRPGIRHSPRQPR